MEWYCWLPVAVIYMIGLGFIFRFIIESDDNSASMDAEIALFVSALWPVTVWSIIGGAVAKKIFKNGGL